MLRITRNRADKHNKRSLKKKKEKKSALRWLWHSFKQVDSISSAEFTALDLGG